MFLAIPQIDNLKLTFSYDLFYISEINIFKLIKIIL